MSILAAVSSGLLTVSYTYSSKTLSRYLKENAAGSAVNPMNGVKKVIVHKVSGRSTSLYSVERYKLGSQATARKGPPRSVLDRIKVLPPPATDSDSDPLDFLS